MKNRLGPLSLLLVAVTTAAVFGLTLVVAGEKPLPQPQTSAADQPTQETVSLRRQVELLQSSLAAKTPQEAVETWAEAVRRRNGAAQLAMMSPKLREQKRSEYEAMNWVTGVSSPWVNKSEVTSVRKVGEKKWEFEVTFETATSTGPAGTDVTKLVVERFEDSWYISSLSQGSR